MNEVDQMPIEQEVDGLAANHPVIAARVVRGCWGCAMSRRARASLIASVVVALVGVFPGVGAARAASKPPSSSQTSTAGQASRHQHSDPIYAVGPTRAYHLNTPYGTIYGEIVWPDVPAGVRVPVILTVSPYNVLREPNIAMANPVRTPPENDDVAGYFVPRGYARAVFDLPGTHNSSGCWDYGGMAERKSAAAVVDFVGGLPESSGKVGMIGISYDGTTELEAAVERPKHLAAIIPQAAMGRQYDYVYWGGVSYSKTPLYPTPATFDFGFAQAPPLDRNDPEANLAALRSRTDLCDRIEHNMRVPQDDPVYDDFWVERDYRSLAARVNVPVLFEAGWQDTNVPAYNSIRFFESMRADVPKRLSLGQWGHGSGQFPDSLALRQAWFDQFLLGLDTGVLDGPQVDTQTTNGVRHLEKTWPPSGTSSVDVPLVTGSPTAGQAGLTDGPPSFTDNDPAFVGYEAGGADPLSTWVYYRTPPLAENVRISGAPLLRLKATSTNSSTHYCFVLFDYNSSPVGLITTGYLNSRNRNGLDVSQPVTPGQVYNAPIDTHDTDYIVPAGHSIEIFLTSSCLGARSDVPIGSTNTILDGSYLTLPISDGAGALANHKTG